MISKTVINMIIHVDQTTLNKCKEIRRLLLYLTIATGIATPVLLTLARIYKSPIAIIAGVGCLLFFIIASAEWRRQIIIQDLVTIIVNDKCRKVIEQEFSPNKSLTVSA